MKDMDYSKNNRLGITCGRGFFYRILFIIFVAELILGGGGHLIDIGGISFRILIFSAITFIFMIYIFAFRTFFAIPPYLSAFFVTSLIIFVFWGLFIGLSVSSNGLSFVLGDSNAWLYVLIFIPFHQWAVRYKWKPEFIVTSVVSLTTILALITDFAFLIMLFSPTSIAKVHNVFNKIGNALGADVYVGLMPDGFLRVMWINSLFLLPSIAFITLSFLKLYNKKTVLRSVLLFIIFLVNVLAVFASYSRGLWIGSILFLLIGLILIRNKRIIVTSIVSLLSGLVPLSVVGKINLFHFLTSRLSSSFSVSDIANAVKIAETKALLNSIMESPLLGRGFGYVSPYFVASLSNPYSYEVFIFDITMKVGLIGDMLIILMLWYIFKHLFSIRREFIRRTMYFYSDAVSLIVSTLIAILFVGLTNPFLNSSVGFGAIGLLLFFVALLERNSSIIFGS
jgi:hypothetical protein